MQRLKINLFKYLKVVDHCHYTGKYRCAAHHNCNLGFKTSYVVPVIAHNGSNYDHHFVLSEIAKILAANPKLPFYLKCIPKTEEGYISWEFRRTITVVVNKKKVKKEAFRFLDSYKFINESLDTLVNNSTKVIKAINLHKNSLGILK